MLARVQAILVPGVLAVGLAACSHGEERTAQRERGSVTGKRAYAEVFGQKGSPLRGRAVLTEYESGILIILEIQNAPPGAHGVHVHEAGDCSEDGFTTVGGHFNPDDRPHGSPESEEHHGGDLGNMSVAENGVGMLRLFAWDLTVAPGTHSVVGRSIVVHRDTDDFVSQPTGNTGPPIACGVIRSVNAPDPAVSRRDQ